MKVSELAEQFNTTSEIILETLKSLKLKSKDSQQELNVVVVSVLKTELVKRGVKSGGKVPETKSEEKTVDVKAEVKSEEKPEKDITVKKASSTTRRKATTKKIAVKKNDESDGKEKKTRKTCKIQKKVEEQVIKKKEDTKVKQQEEDKKEEKKDVVVAKTKTVSKGVPKVRSRVNNAPVITLKPLARKRKKPMNTVKESVKPLVEAVSDEKAATIIPVQADQDGVLKRAIIDHEASKQADSSQEGEDQQIDVGYFDDRDESLPDMEIQVPITVKDFSVKIQQKVNVVLRKLMGMGILTHINQSLDGEIIHKLMREFGFNLAKIKTQEEQLIDVHKMEEEDTQFLSLRAPVVTFMGHVDHGKTTLLDCIRKSKVADDEHGGITQHMSAYSVKINKGRITFLDTPGHAAFTAMRARGAHITDLVVLVVAADEGVKPQTREAIDHARAADVPIVVALNKIDRESADIDRVKKQLSEVDLASEDWGGKTVMTGVSALTGEGVDNLLEMILLEAEMLELKANDQKRASGIVVEAHLSQGKGAVATLIVQSGNLKEGDTIVVGPFCGKVKAIFNDHGRSIKEAGPSMPVEILGLSSVPEAGETFYVVEEERQARDICLRRQEQLDKKRLQAKQAVTLEGLYSHLQEGTIKGLNVIIKADVQGSLEALMDSLGKIPSDKVKMKIIHAGVGDVNASDVILASVSKAIIIAFHVGTGPRAKEELKKEPVDIREYRIIYAVEDDMRKALEGLLEAKTKKNFLSRLEIREVFKLSKQGIVAGCYVTKGKVHRKAHIDVLRGDEVVFTGNISSLKRFKDDVRDVNEGMECGVTIQGFDKIKSGDIIEAYELEKIVQTL